MPSPSSPHSLRGQTDPTANLHGRIATGAHSPSSPSGAPSRAEFGAETGSSPTSPRRRREFARDFALQQNTDPLVHHRSISPDPVNNTRTPLQPKARACTADTYHTNPPDHSRSHLDFSFLSQKPSPQQHQPALFAPRSAPQAYNDHVQSAPIENDGGYYPYPDLERNGGSASPLAVDYNQSVPSEHQFHEPPAQNNACSDRQFLPITPVSPSSAGPRWASLPLNRGKITTLTIDAPLSPDRVFPPTPTRTPKSPLFSAALHSHPYIPEEEPLDSQYESETTRYEHAGPVTTTMSGHADRIYRPDSRMSGDTAYSADNYNFSRPRKPSLKSLNAPDFAYNMALRPSTAKSTVSDSLRFESRTITSSPQNTPYQAYQQSGPRRQPSVGSTMSSSTYTSVGPGLRHKVSQDVMSTHRNVSQNAAAGTLVGLPHTVRPQAPPRHYNRGGPPAQQQQSHLYEDEMRASVKSQLTTSTAQETLFSEPERSSVMTKTSSVFASSFRNTRQSSFFGPHAPVLDVRDSLSVDDVMGMYETGFNDSEMDLARRMSGMDMAERIEASVVRLTPDRMDDHDDSRPGTALSHNSEAANRLLEAMSQTGPLPIPGRSFPLNGDSPVILPDTKAFFRKSLARSIPKDMRLSYISTKSKMDGVYGQDDEKDDLTIETDSARHSRHDSGKMVDPRSEENSPIEDPEKNDITLFAVDTPSEPIKDSLSPPSSTAVPTPAQPAPSQNIQGALQPEDLDPEANDRYGFRKQNQYITRQHYDEWNGPYSEYLARRRKKWEAFLKENGLMTDKPNRFPQHSAKAKRFVRKGIPPDWRGAAWFYYAGGPKILANNRGVYDQMLKRVADGGLKEVCREDIERDLYRTFPDNVRFKRGAAAGAAGQDSSGTTPAHSRNNSTQSANPLPRAPGSEPKIIDQLRRVLSAFAVFNPNIGYCQSLNFLGGMLLLFVENEEQAFWLLNIITRVYLPGTHEMNLEGSKVDLSVLMAELQTTLPGVWVKISDDGSTTTKKKSRRHRHRGAAAPEADNLPPVTLALTAWFMSCFIGTLPTETTLRVWDVFFYEGSKTLFRVALAIFKAGENEIKAINDPMEVFAVVQTLPRKMLDANLLMETCFKRRSGLNHITSEEIDRSRTERREKLHVEQREKVAAAQGGSGLQTAATIMMSRKPSDLLSVDSEDGGRRKHTLFGRRAHTGTKAHSGLEV
ncbi:hypothetical protein N0V93_009995 [Gnomoniopsis smithogilvyi]|uniref:Rab-GAP TBC domain-containing protein n=1 Tax=Gnomoniopsis smithogilvyi TaxID=1191159 RepID=A0A9W8YJ81_9PEZI|nr:hypothetical protein N0V93_009995 [Gnomoniopsis smithogilvyi]